MKKKSKIVRRIKILDLSTVSYEWQKGIDDKPYGIGNYVYTINDGLEGSYYYVIADRAKVYPYDGLHDKMEDGLCNTQFGIMNVVNGIKTKEEYDVWINKNPINVLYALGTPTEETIPYLENDSSDFGLSFQDNAIPSPTLPSEIKNVEVSEFKVVGKNLFNIEKIGADTPYATIDCYIVKDIVFSTQKKPTVTKSIWRFMAISKDGTRQYIEDSMGVISFKATSENPIVQIQYRSLGITGGAYEGIMFEYGTVPTDYEPYKEQVVTLSNPITMSSTLNNKIADIIDINEGMITKNLTIIHAMNKKLDTTEGWIYNYETITYATRKDDYLKGPIGGCNSFDVSTNISYMDNYGNITLIPKPSFITNIDEWLEYVKDKDYYFLLPLKNPTTEALPQEDVEQLKKLKTFTGHTNIICNAPVSFEYEKSIQIVIDELVKAIQKQTNSIKNIERAILENV